MCIWRLLLHETGRRAAIFLFVSEALQSARGPLRAVVSDRFDGTAIEGFFGDEPLFFGHGLAKDEGMGFLVVSSENLRRSFSAEIAVDALIINVVGAFGVVWESVGMFSHAGDYGATPQIFHSIETEKRS
jgi:hypothetical protein